MKKLFLICSLILLATNAFTQGLFLEKYKKLRKNSSEESFMEVRMDKNSIKEQLKTLDDPQEIELLKKTKTILVGFDIEIDERPEKKELNELINQYEELTSLKNEELDIKVLAKTKKDKINELIVLMDMDEVNWIVDLEFNKPIDINSWADLAGAIKVNNTSVEDIMNGESPSTESSYITVTEDSEDSEDSEDFRTNETLETFKTFENLTIIEQNEKYGAKDKNGKIIIPVKYDKITSFDKLSNLEYFALHKDNKIGLANKMTGNFVISVEYDNIDSFDKLSNIEHITLYKDNKMGLAHRMTGNIVIPVEYDDINSFDKLSNIEHITLYKDNKVGLAHRMTGDIVIPVEYDNIDSFDQLSDDEYIALYKDNKMGLAHRMTGNIIIEPIYENITVNSENQIELIKEDGSVSIYKK